MLVVTHNVGPWETDAGTESGRPPFVGHASEVRNANTSALAFNPTPAPASVRPLASRIVRAAQAP